MGKSNIRTLNSKSNSGLENTTYSRVEHERDKCSILSPLCYRSKEKRCNMASQMCEVKYIFDARNCEVSFN